MSKNDPKQGAGTGAHDLKLSVRGVNIAHDVGARTVGDLVRFTDEELLETRCFGDAFLREVQQALTQRGLRLGMTQAELRGRSDLHGKIVARGHSANTSITEPEHEGACCGHCEEATRKLRERVSARGAEGRDMAEDLERKLAMSLAELELPVRATNSLKAAGITTVRDLVIRKPAELLDIRNFGEVALREVTTKLAAHGLQLGMKPAK